MEKKIKSLNDLRTLLLVTPEFMEHILEQARLGDPDWLLDIISELDEHLEPGAMFYIPEWHGYLNALGYTSADFDTDNIAEELKSLQ